ncbi:MAG: DUF1080 domain-containing protein [Kiritimatiellia bacterium]
MKTHTFTKLTGSLLAASLFCLATPLQSIADAASPFIACWALNLPNGGGGWLSVKRVPDGSLESFILLAGGSPRKLKETKMRGDTLVMTRVRKDRKTKKKIVDLYEARCKGAFIKIERKTINSDGKTVSRASLDGKRIPPHGKKPDLDSLEFGKPVKLFSGNDMSKWKAMNPKAPNCWTIKDGILSNRVKGPDGKKRHGTNIRTEKKFEDFRLTTDVRVPENGNSGIYLRGIYEIQVAESYGEPADSHNMGALYSRITPSTTAEKKPDEWQTLDIILCERYATVILNGTKIIDNQPIMGCTGGAISSDEFAPGPIYLQGDHTDVDYRNMILYPIVK